MTTRLPFILPSVFGGSNPNEVGPGVEPGFPIMSQVVSSTTATTLTSATFNVPANRLIVVLGSWANRTQQTLFDPSPSLTWVTNPPGATGWSVHHTADSGAPSAGRARIRFWVASNTSALTSVSVRMTVPAHTNDPASGQLVVWVLDTALAQGATASLSDYSGATGPLHSSLNAQYASSLILWQASTGRSTVYTGGAYTGNTLNFTTENVGGAPASNYQHFSGRLTDYTSGAGAVEVGSASELSDYTLFAAAEFRWSQGVQTTPYFESTDDRRWVRMPAAWYSFEVAPPPILPVISKTFELDFDGIISPAVAHAIQGVVPIARPGFENIDAQFDAYAVRPPVGPSLEAGWPVSNTLRAAPTSALAISAPPTQGSSRLLVLSVSGRGSGNPFPATVSGLGLTWLRIGGQADGTPGNYTAEVWAAWAGGPTASGPVTVQFQNALAKTVQATLYSFVGTAGGSPVVSSCFGSSASARYTGGGTGTRTVTMPSSRARSAIIYAIASGDALGLAEASFCASDTIVTDGTVGASLSSGRFASSSGGPIQIGADGTSGDYFLQAFEILSYVQPGVQVADIADRYPPIPPYRWSGPVEYVAPRQPDPLSTMGFFHGPDRWLRPWNPERSSTVLPNRPSAQFVPDLPALPGLPTRPRYAWNPERSWHVRPIVPTQDVVIPRSPVQPSLPERMARPAPPPLWRGDTFWYPETPAPVPSLWGFRGPDRARLPWDPERTSTAAVAGPASVLVVLPGAPVPPMLPGRFRPAWEPERSAVVYPPREIPVVVPDQPPPAVEPHYFMRPSWNPERTSHVFPVNQGVVRPYGVLTGPHDVLVRVTFRCALDVYNPTSSILYVFSVRPLFGDPEQSGVLGFPAQPGSPPPINPLWFAKIAPGARGRWEWDAVLYEDGPADIHADVYICDRLAEALRRRPDTILQPDPISVFARRIGE